MLGFYVLDLSRALACTGSECDVDTVPVTNEHP
jgi:hypothetical protein